MSNFSFTYPLYYIFLCAFVGLLFAFGHYYRNEKFKEHAAWIKYLLAFLRFLLVTSLCLLLMEPILRLFKDKQQDPIIAVFQDVSSSLTTGSDLNASDYFEDLTSFSSSLGSNFKVDQYQFGAAIKENFSDSCAAKNTNLSEVLSFSEQNYANQNLGAIILFSDGIYNAGKHPLYQKTSIKAPLYTVALGDTSARKDIIVRQVLYNPIAYLEDKQNVQIDIEAIDCTARKVQVSLYQKRANSNVLIQRTPVQINSNNYFKTIEFTIDHQAAGNQSYFVQVSEIENELSTYNNYKNFNIDVIDGKQKIQLIARAPHPDLAALRRIINDQKNYEIELVYASAYKASAEAPDLIIFHDLPSVNYPISNIISKTNKEKIPSLFIIGAQTNLISFNKSQEVVQISGNNRSVNQVQAEVNPDFKLFITDSGEHEKIKEFLPLVAPYGNYKLSKGSNVFLYQKIGNITTDYPLLSYSSIQKKTAVFSGEGIWKWRLFDQLQHGNTDISSSILLKTIQYLTIKEDKRKFRAHSSKNSYTEAEPVQIVAELYNNVYELVNETDVFLDLSDQNGNTFNYTFSKTKNAYDLSLGLLAPGSYRYTANTNAAGLNLQAKGQFVISDIQLEAYDLKADHVLLAALSEKYGGKMIDYSALPALENELMTNNNIKPILYQTSTSKSVIHLKYIFFALLLFMSAEWFTRRYYGSY